MLNKIITHKPLLLFSLVVLLSLVLGSQFISRQLVWRWGNDRQSEVNAAHFKATSRLFITTLPGNLLNISTDTGGSVPATIAVSLAYVPNELTVASIKPDTTTCPVVQNFKHSVENGTIQFTCTNLSLPKNLQIVSLAHINYAPKKAASTALRFTREGNHIYSSQSPDTNILYATEDLILTSSLQ